MKLRLHSELLKKPIQSTSRRLPLTFNETMEINGVRTSFELYESCFVHLHDKLLITEKKTKRKDFSSILLDIIYYHHSINQKNY
jgi:hypothetical protein